jgi:hypothetical protein
MISDAFIIGQPVRWKGYDGVVSEVKGERVVVEYVRLGEPQVALTSRDELRAQQEEAE